MKKRQPPPLKTADLLRRVPGGVREIAETLSITTQAVYSWGDQVPRLRIYELRIAKPEWFRAAE